jgi:hypothetical protein
MRVGAAVLSRYRRIMSKSSNTKLTRSRLRVLLLAVNLKGEDSRLKFSVLAALFRKGSGANTAKPWSVELKLTSTPLVSREVMVAL